MGQKFKIDDKEYEVEKLSEHARDAISALEFTKKRIKELDNTQALLRRAKNSYVESLKMEMLSDKSGFIFGED